MSKKRMQYSLEFKAKVASAAIEPESGQGPMRVEDLMRSRMLADSIRARSADTSFEGRIYGSIILFVKQQILSCNTGRTIYDLVAPVFLKHM